MFFFFLVNELSAQWKLELYELNQLEIVAEKRADESWQSAVLPFLKETLTPIQMASWAIVWVSQGFVLGIGLDVNNPAFAH